MPTTFTPHDKLVANALKVNTKPLWTQMAKMNPREPNPKCVPTVWRYEEVRPLLVEAGVLVTDKDAERRALMFVNPGRDAPYTTDTIASGLQLVMPNETAPAHRHLAFAMRFVIEGQGGFTAIQGKRVWMQRGDVILNPTWNWHDQGKDGSGPMIWLDGLDIPNFIHFPVHFVEHYKDQRYPAEDVDSNISPLVFPWKVMQQKLDSKPGEWTSEDYLRSDGAPVSKSLGGCAERLNPGASSPAVRETASSIYHVITGAGYSDINGQRLAWKEGDSFCVPAWNKYQHTNTGSETVYLYRIHDKPMLNNLGYYRLDGCDVESLVSA
ncbi:gentisate 1,2-dioxygenase [Fonsecaea erecta]|uniref:Gentisate 1,2-dioxygenase n=1 Tax=Fonsecaea erecta TaxID=1367422 RepID=A0A178ZKY3_9EURO|nr:gentisate 1,2-dioxygenase [Fonsecaea erecta]OAP60066.1 gentisate 1,2-dioxygenase [Fonsecaea erecta]